MNIAKTLKKEALDILNPIFLSAHEGVLNYSDDNQIILKSQMNKNSNVLTSVLGLITLGEKDGSQDEVHLHTIFIPESFREQGYGFGVINKLREVCNQYNYDFYIVNMVPSFYNRMIQKGAVVADEDSVLVTQDTQLLQKRSAK